MTVPVQLAPYAFKQGNAGRPPGPNKLTQFLREVMGSTFHKIGGPEAFAEWAMNHKTEFYTKLWIKLLPDSSQLSEEEREKVIDAMIGVQKVMTELYTGEDDKPIINIESVKESQPVQNVDSSDASTVEPETTIPPLSGPKVAE